MLGAADDVPGGAVLPHQQVHRGQLGLGSGSVNVVIVNLAVHLEGVEQLDARGCACLQFLESSC